MTNVDLGAQTATYYVFILFIYCLHINNATMFLSDISVPVFVSLC